MHRGVLTGLGLWACIAFVGPAMAADEPPTALIEAIEHLRKGRYDEALEAFTDLVEGGSPPSVEASVGLAETHLARGEWDEAEKVLGVAADQHPESAQVHGRLADLHFQRGRYAAAAKSADRALQLKPDELRAKLVQARLKIETGKIEEAIDDFRSFVRYYNQAQPKDAETLLLVAEGSVEYARAKSISQIFNFVVNELTPDVIKADPDRWEAHFIAGSLLLEKYNQGQAVQELNAAAAINAHSADVLGALGQAAISEQEFEKAGGYADRALAVNPRHEATLILATDLSLAASDVKSAHEFATRAKDVNPSSQAVLARLAACDLLTNGIPEAGLSETFLNTGEADAALKDREFVAIYRDLIARNSAPGEFLTDLGGFFEQERRWNSADRCYTRAIEVAPQLSTPRTSLGLLKMRTGEIDKARQILDAAFKSDPFHVRVSNMRKVLGVLEGYDTLQTEHFVIRFDKSDRLQAEFMAEYLEEIYPGLTKEFGYEPPTRTPFELYSGAKNQSAHSWFSARMIGLPWIQTIGASTGMIVALASPTASRETYDWARVVKHEFSHILTLQETGFAIPHWFTEALAVRTEGNVFPDEWRRILLERSQKDDLFTLLTLNQGFQRPRNGDDWQCAYCLSRLYARYMEETFGTDSLFKLVDAYRRGLKTEAAIPEVFGKPLADFEKGFRTWLDGILAELRVGRAPDQPSLSEAEAAAKSNPDDADAKASYAWAMLNVAPLARAKEAKKLADEAVAASPGQPLALGVQARLLLRERKEDAALEKMLKAFVPDAPHPAIVGLLGRFYLEDKQFDKAAAVFEAGLKQYPKERGWIRALALANLRLDRKDTLPELMQLVAEHDFDDAGSRKWLLANAVEHERWEDAIRWGTQAWHIDVRDAKTHRLLGQAYLHVSDPAKARRHLEVALALDPDDAEAKELLGSLPASDSK